MISRAIEAGVPFAWFTANEAYGQASTCGRGWKNAMCSMCWPSGAGEQRADALIAAAPAWAWQRLSTGAGAHGLREFYWGRIRPCNSR
jgi:hypothetical protein